MPPASLQLLSTQAGDTARAARPPSQRPGASVASPKTGPAPSSQPRKTSAQKSDVVFSHALQRVVCHESGLMQACRKFSARLSSARACSAETKPPAAQKKHHAPIEVPKPPAGKKWAAADQDTSKVHSAIAEALDFPNGVQGLKDKVSLQVKSALWTMLYEQGFEMTSSKTRAYLNELHQDYQELIEHPHLYPNLANSNLELTAHALDIEIELQKPDGEVTLFAPVPTIRKTELKRVTLAISEDKVFAAVDVPKAGDDPAMVHKTDSTQPVVYKPSKAQLDALKPGFHWFNPPADGNCFFHALNKAFPELGTHKELRARLAERVEERAKVEADSASILRSAAEDIKIPGRYNGEDNDTVSVAAEAFGLKITVIWENGRESEFGAKDAERTITLAGNNDHFFLMEQTP